MTKTIVPKKEILEVQQKVEFDLKNYMRKRAFSNIAHFLNNPSVQVQVQAIQTLVDFYETYPQEEDKLLSEFLKSYMPMHKFSALLVISGISLLHPEFGFPKMVEALNTRKETKEFAANALQNSWKNQEEAMIKNIVRYWDMETHPDLKIVAVLTINTQTEDEEDVLLDFLGKFIEDSDIQLRNQLVGKLKDFYIREPIVVEAKLRYWLVNARTQNPEHTIVQMIREIAKRKDPFLLDRTSIIMKNWVKNEKLKPTATIILDILANNHQHNR